MMRAFASFPTGPPMISGVARDGQTLRTTNGSWSGPNNGRQTPTKSTAVSDRQRRAASHAIEASARLPGEEGAVRRGVAELVQDSSAAGVVDRVLVDRYARVRADVVEAADPDRGAAGDDERAAATPGLLAAQSGPISDPNPCVPSHQPASNATPPTEHHSTAPSAEGRRTEPTNSHRSEVRTCVRSL